MRSKKSRPGIRQLASQSSHWGWKPRPAGATMAGFVSAIAGRVPARSTCLAGKPRRRGLGRQSMAP
jgi:hypothetical protein